MMTIKEIYDLAVKMGINADPRGAAAVKKKLENTKKRYDKMSVEDKAEYDLVHLTNPYADTRIYFGDPNKKVKRLLAGIDIESGELMLADKLGAKEPIDLVISHHPMGVGLVGLDEVMDINTHVYVKCGVPINIAEGLTLPRMQEVSRSVNSSNYNQAIDTARLINMPIMSTHTVCDNMVTNFLQKTLDQNKNKLERVEDVLNVLKEIPEYKEASKYKAGPKLYAGSKDRYAGKIALTEVTGGTSGPKDIYEKLAHAGVGTIIGMHMREEWRKEAEKHHINVIIAGHMSSDSLGMNLFLDEVEKKGVEVIVCSGLTRIKRFKNKK